MKQSIRLGRCDTLLKPKDEADDGIILEYKKFDLNCDKNLKDTVERALKQVKDKKYKIALEAKGIHEDRIKVYAFAFKGKEILIERGQEG